MKILRGLSIAVLGVSAFLLLLPSVRATEYPGSFVDWTQFGVRTATTFVGDSDMVFDIDLRISDASTFLGFANNAMLLISPWWDVAYIFDNSTNAISGKSLFLTYLDDSASSFLTQGIPPYTGSFKPADSFTLFNGEFATGTWTLAVYNDALGGNSGAVNSWTLIINPPSPTVTPSPIPGVPTPTPTTVPLCPVYAGTPFSVIGWTVTEESIQLVSPRKVEKVTVNIEELIVGLANDLDHVGMYLVSPSDTVVALFEKHQLSESNLSGTWFESSDIYPLITTGVGPYIGRWRPVGDLTSLNGEPINGAWRLVVFNDIPPDPAGLEVVSVNDWSLVICEAAATPTPTPTPLTTPTPTPVAFKTCTPTPTPKEVCRLFSGSGFSWSGVDVLASTIQVPGGEITDVDITIEEADTTGDLSTHALYLLAPDLTHVALFKKLNLSGDRLYQTTFDSKVGLDLITDGEAPYLGSYNPVETLSAFSGQSTAGNWKLLLYNESASSGSVTGWTLRVCAKNPDPTPTASPSVAPTPTVTPSSHPPIPTPVPACPVYIGDTFTVYGTTIGEQGLNIVRPGEFIGDLDIRVSFHMLEDGDLDKVSMYLCSGQGTVVELFPKHSLSEHALYQTYFDDAAFQAVTEGLGPYVGPWRPTGTLSNFNNEPTTGTWSLIVFNDYSCEGVGCLDEGIVDDWRVYVCAAPSRTPTPVPSATPLTSPTPTPDGFHTPIPATPSPTPPCIEYVGSSLPWTGIDVATSIITVSDPGVVVGMQLTIDEAYCDDSWDSVGMYLMGPSGEDVALFEKHQLSEHQFYLTTFDDSASQAITSGMAPYIGNWRPQEPLSNFSGEWATGTWTLVVYNDSADNSGNVTGWNLSLCAFPPPTATPTPIVVPPTPTPLSGALPILASGDYNGDGTSDIGVYRPSVGQWIIQVLGTDFLTGAPASGDYDGDGTADIAVFRPATGEWVIDNLTRFYFGTGGDVPVPGDYDGDGTTDAVIYRGGNPSLWAVRNLNRAYFGVTGDVPVPGDYDGDGGTDFAVFRPSTSLWAVINSITRFYFGGAGDFVLPRDYDGDGTSEAAIFRPLAMLWSIRDFSRFYFGTSGDLPVPADFDGDGQAEAAIFRGSSGLWAIRGLGRIYYGASGDTPVAR